MRLRPEPAPQAPRLTRHILSVSVEDWLAVSDPSQHKYSRADTRRAAAQNLTFAILRTLRGSEQQLNADAVLSHVDALSAARRLRRAVALFADLADRLED